MFEEMSQRGCEISIWEQLAFVGPQQAAGPPAVLSSVNYYSVMLRCCGQVLETRKVPALHAQADLAQSKLKAVAKEQLPPLPFQNLSLQNATSLKMFTESVNLPLATAEDSWHWYGPHNGVPYVTIASGVHCITPGYTTSLFISPAGKALA